MAPRLGSSFLLLSAAFLLFCVAHASAFTANATVVGVGNYRLDPRAPQILLEQPAPIGYGLQTTVYLYDAFLNVTTGNEFSMLMYLARYSSAEAREMLGGRRAAASLRSGSWSEWLFGSQRHSAKVGEPELLPPARLPKNLGNVEEVASPAVGATSSPYGQFDVIAVSGTFQCSVSGGKVQVAIPTCRDLTNSNPSVPDFCESGWIEATMSSGPYYYGVGNANSIPKASFGITNWISSVSYFLFVCQSGCPASVTTQC